MENKNEEVVEKKESKIKKFFKSDMLKTVTLIGTMVLTIANTVFLIWTCSSAAETEVNAEVLEDYNKLKGMEVEPANIEMGA